MPRIPVRAQGEEGQDGVPFTVSDDSGTVVVDPEGATLTFDRDIVSNTGAQIKTEWRLEPGESVYVSGQYRDGSTGSAPGDARAYIGAGEDGSTFTVSDASQTRTILRFLAKGTVFSVLGLVMLSVGLGLLYFTGVF